MSVVRRPTLPADYVFSASHRMDDEVQITSHLEDEVVEAEAGRGPYKTNWMMTINNYGPDDELAFRTNLALFQFACYGKEVSRKGTPHLQCFVQFHKKVRLTAIRRIWPRARAKTTKGTPYQNMRYCAKGEQTKAEYLMLHDAGPNYGKNADFSVFGIPPNKPAISPYVAAFQMLDNGSSVHDAVQHIVKERPRDIALHGSQIRANFSAHKKQEFRHDYVSTQFTVPLETDFTKPILIWGSSGLGKTEYAKAHFKNPFVVIQSNMESLRRLSPDNDGIIFDDCSFHHFSPSDVIALLGRGNTPRALKCRYQSADIPPRMPTIFTYNLCNPFYDAISAEQREAVNSRFRAVHVTLSLFDTSQ